MFDLHVHTRYSDGVLTPREVVQLAVAAGLEGMALTDHDTTAGWHEAATAATAHDLEVIGGIELSTEFEGASVHVLGYWVDPDFAPLVAELERLTGARLRRAERILAHLSELGIDLALDDVRAIAGDAAIARPHIAEALVAHGFVEDLRAAFTDYLGDGAAAYAPKRALDPADGIALIRAAGGVAVLAHPGIDRGMEGQPVGRALFQRLVDAGLAGVEADHPGHDVPTRDRWRQLAGRHELVVTGSSDFHGRYEQEQIGQSWTSKDVVSELAARASGGRVAVIEGK